LDQCPLNVIMSTKILNEFCRVKVNNEYGERDYLLQHRVGKQLAYTNQIDAANAIVGAFTKDNCRAVTLIAQPGVGKTGTSLYCAKQMMTLEDDSKLIHYNNVVFISGMSDTDWEEQLKNSLIDCLKESVFHRGRFGSPELHTKLETIKRERSGLIIIDECHIAAQLQHQMTQTLDAHSLLSKEILDGSNIRFLNVSATPAHTLYDSEKYLALDHKKIKLNPSPTYRGFQFLLDNNLLRHADSLDLLEQDGAEELGKIINKRWGAIHKRYHIVRLNPNSAIQTCVNLQVLCNKQKWKLLYHWSDKRIEDVDALMSTEPPEHTILVVKGFWRASKRLVDNYVGILYEQPVKIPDSNVIVQGLVGRFCKNDSSPFDESVAPLFYCTIGVLCAYLESWKTDFDFSKSDSKSRVLSSKDGVVKSKPSFMQIRPHSNTASDTA